MKKTQQKFECDLCGDTAIDPKNWLEVSIECLYVDRMWTDKTICPSCQKKIELAKAKLRENQS